MVLGMDRTRPRSPATNGAAHLALTGPFPTNTVPPLTGQFASTAGWVGRFANGVVISNLVNRAFSDSFPLPPDLTDPVHSFTSSVDVDISVDGGASFGPYSGSGSNTMAISAVGSQRFFRLLKPVN